MGTYPLVTQACRICYRMLPRDAENFAVKTTPQGKERLTTVCLECWEKEANATEKKCPKCKRMLPADLDHFYANAANQTTGLSSWCKDCKKAASEQRYTELTGRAPIPKTRDKWDAQEHDYLTPEIQEEYEKTGSYPRGFYPCRRCKKVKANTTRMFPAQPRAFRQPGSGFGKEGDRKLSTVCRSCQNKQRRRAHQRQKYEQEMRRARINEEWEPDTEADMRRWAQLPPEEQENW